MAPGSILLAHVFHGLFPGRSRNYILKLICRVHKFYKTPLLSDIYIGSFKILIRCLRLVRVWSLPLSLLPAFPVNSGTVLNRQVRIYIARYLFRLY